MSYHPDHEAADLRIELDLMTQDRDRVMEDRNSWIILFNKLERHVTRHFDNSPSCNVHEAGGEFDLDEDLELYRGWVSVMNAAKEKTS